MMGTLCRSCLTDVDSNEKRSFYDITQEVDPKAPNLYTLLTAIELDRDNDEAFPQQLCGDCTFKFELIRDFRSTCILSSQWLIQQMLPDKNDTESENEMDIWKEERPNQDVNYVVEIDIQKSHLLNTDEMQLSSAAILRESPENQTSHYECDICNRVFIKRHRIKAHLRQHCGLKPYACPLCNQSFAKWNSKRIHEQKHHSSQQTEVFRCEFDGCTKFYDLRQTLKVHQDRIHLGIKREPPNTNCICETCGKSFKSKWFLTAHNFTHGSPDHWPFPCELCPKRFISKYKLKIHTMRHNNIKNFACHLCDMRTCTKKEMDTHIAYHNKDFSFPCDKCESMFRSKVALQRHNRVVQRGHKPYNCAFCSLSFAKPDTLKHHTMRHTGEKPHACHLCDRRFIQVVALRAHMKTHSKSQ